MDLSDANAFGQQAVKLGLIDDQLMRESMEEAITECGKTPPDLIHLTRTLERKGLMTNYQTTKILKGDTDGFFLGGYRILYKISSGSFGRVFRAADPQSGRVVAVKVLRRRWSEDRARIDLFFREGKVGLTLKHPNIVEVLAVSQDILSGQYYLVMEFVEGGNLREILQIQPNRTLSLPTALHHLEDAASGLAYAYSRGITHRDLKLTNVLISSGGEAKLVDFGLAQIYAGVGREEDQVDRTVDYAGLEKATGVKSGDVRSDVFFLGCVFYEMLLGRAPLEMTRDRHARMRPQRFQEVKTLKPGEINAPASVFALSDTMLAFDPRRRYQTPSQLLDAVRAARRDVELAAQGAASGKPVARSVFIAESHEGLQQKLREGFKEAGYRVLLASDPTRALDRFRQQPYDALIVDAETVGEDGVHVFERVLSEAREKSLNCAAILILAPEQADWAERVSPRKNACVMVRPVGFKQLRAKLKELIGD